MYDARLKRASEPLLRNTIFTAYESGLSFCRVADDPAVSVDALPADSGPCGSHAMPPDVCVHMLQRLRVKFLNFRKWLSVKV